MESIYLLSRMRDEWCWERLIGIWSMDADGCIGNVNKGNQRAMIYELFRIRRGIGC